MQYSLKRSEQGQPELTWLTIIIANYPFCLFDGYELPFRDRAIDLGILIHVLHHTDDAEKLLTECRRVIKDKIIIFEDMASCRVQNGFTTFHDFWATK